MLGLFGLEDGVHLHRDRCDELDETKLLMSNSACSNVQCGGYCFEPSGRNEENRVVLSERRAAKPQSTEGPCALNQFPFRGHNLFGKTNEPTFNINYLYHDTFHTEATTFNAEGHGLTLYNVYDEDYWH